ncbi:MAG: hypothetical protein KIS76_08095 [Pyrinomonadaceae bacterium]|nr:hypothetical protein [Pyrinomonadaceae bacterium]
MEPQFDKEIHALLHNFGKTAEPRAIPDSVHLDADELSAFAENAIPDKARSNYVTHLSECDRCRKALSSLVPVISSEIPAAVKAPVISDTSIPWYRSLFAFGKLAYVMGALVIAFTGLTAFVLFQSMNSGGFERAAADKSSASAEIVNQQPAGNVNSAISANSFATPTESELPQTAANVPMLNANTSARTQLDKTERAKELEKDDAALGASTMSAPREDQPAIVSDRQTVTEEEKSARKNSAESVAAAEPKPAPAPVEVPSKPADRDTALAKKKTQEDLQYAEGQLGLRSEPGRSVSGKKFNFRDGVWYDSSYSNQKTKNVRRDSSDYRKLDPQLRAIVEKLDGTVVIIWKSEAYRIQ